MREGFDPIVLAAFRPADQLLHGKSKGRFLRGSAWSAPRAMYCTALIDSGAVVFNLWLIKLNAKRAQQVRTLDQASTRELAAFFTWLVIFCFQLANEMNANEGDYLLVPFDELFLRGLGYEQAGFELFAEQNQLSEPMEDATFEAMSEAERWVTMNMPFMKPIVATLNRLSNFDNVDEAEELAMRMALFPALDASVKHIANALGVQTKALVM